MHGIEGMDTECISGNRALVGPDPHGAACAGRACGARQAGRATATSAEATGHGARAVVEGIALVACGDRRAVTGASCDDCDVIGRATCAATASGSVATVASASALAANLRACADVEGASAASAASALATAAALAATSALASASAEALVVFNRGVVGRGHAWSRLDNQDAEGRASGGAALACSPAFCARSPTAAGGAVVDVGRRPVDAAHRAATAAAVARLTITSAPTRGPAPEGEGAGGDGAGSVRRATACLACVLAA